MSHNNQTLSLVAWRRMYFSTHLFIHTYAMYVCVCWVLFCSIVQRCLIIDSPSEAAVAMLSRYDVLLCSHCTHYCTALHCSLLPCFGLLLCCARIGAVHSTRSSCKKNVPFCAYYIRIQHILQPHANYPSVLWLKCERDNTPACH